MHLGPVSLVWQYWRLNLDFPTVIIPIQDYSGRSIHLPRPLRLPKQIVTSLPFQASIIRKIIRDKAIYLGEGANFLPFFKKSSFIIFSYYYFFTGINEAALNLKTRIMILGMFKLEFGRKLPVSYWIKVSVASLPIALVFRFHFVWNGAF